MDAAHNAAASTQAQGSHSLDTFRMAVHVSRGFADGVSHSSGGPRPPTRPSGVATANGAALGSLIIRLESVFVNGLQGLDFTIRF